MRAVHALLVLLLTAPVLGASALDPPEGATTPPGLGTHDSCVRDVLPSGAPAPLQAACVDLPLLVDEGGDTMTGNLRLDNGAALDFASGGLLQGFSTTNLRYGSRAVCLASVAATGCGDIEGVTAGTGLSGGATSGTASLSVNAAVIQSRVATTCAAGSAIRAIAQDGSVTCETDDGQVYTGTSPVAISGTTIGLSTTGCVAGEAWLWSGSAWNCDNLATQAELDAVKAALDAKDATLQNQVNSHTTTLNGHATTLTSHTNSLASHAATLDSQQAQLDAVNAEVDSVQANVNVVSAALATHKTSGDHDARYALDNHGHGVTFGSSGGQTLPGGTATTFLTTSFFLADECPGAEQHRVLLQGGGSGILTSGTNTHLESQLVLDGTALGTTRRWASLATSAPFASLHHQLLTTLAPGNHTLGLQIDNGNVSTSVLFDDPSVLIQHLGWSCT